MHLRQEMNPRGRDAKRRTRALQILTHVVRLVAGCNRETEARVGASGDPAVTGEESVTKPSFAQQRAFQELCAVGHGDGFMRPVGPVLQVSVPESVDQDELSQSRRARGP